LNNNYIKKRGITHPWILSPKPKKKFNQIIIIPSLGESNHLPQTLSSISENDKILLNNTLVIVVINNSKSASLVIKNDNKKTLQILSTIQYPFFLAIIDATSPDFALPVKHAGVGLARKIGMDLSIPFLKNKTSLLLSIDADTILSPNYLQTILHYFNNYDINAAVVGFKHTNSKRKNLEQAIRKYEKFLISTAKNIYKTGSPYGYVSMGSTIACTGMAYMAVGGMPKKKATEDFYFLQELAKFCGVFTIPEILVYPSCRPISRVYLGTGFRMKQAMEGFNINNLYYSNKSFILLEEWIQLGINSWGINLYQILKKIEQKNISLKQFLLIEGIEKIWGNLQSSSPTKNHFKHQFHRWFDGLKTIRFLKYFTKINN